jgi:polygalacturonase
MIGITPMKIGTETRGGLIENVTWENNEVILCGRPIAIEAKDGALARNITWRNIHVHECNRPFDLEIMRRQDEPDQKRFSRIENATIENLTIDTYGTEGDWYTCHIRGLDKEHGIDHVRIKNLSLEGERIRDLSDMEISVNEHARGIEIC